MSEEQVNTELEAGVFTTLENSAEAAELEAIAEAERQASVDPTDTTSENVAATSPGGVLIPPLGVQRPNNVVMTLTEKQILEIRQKAGINGAVKAATESIKEGLRDFLEQTRKNADASAAELQAFLLEIQPDIETQVSAAIRGQANAQENLAHLYGQIKVKAAKTALETIEVQQNIVATTVVASIRTAINFAILAI